MPVANIYLSFQGVGFASGARRSFDVMAGDNPPTITGGYAKWVNVPRPLQKSLTVFQGYDPIQMTVDVRFGRWGQNGAWLTDDQHARPVQRYDGTGGTEDDIGTLEWMAGSNFSRGPSPVVYVFSHGAQGSDTSLVPPQYAGLPWIVTGLQWGKSYRNPNGFRIWQEATITLQKYLGLSDPPAADANVKGTYFVSRPGRNTPLLIAAAPGVNSPFVDHRILAGRINSDAMNNPCRATGLYLRGRSLSYPVRPGVSVWVPAHQVL